MSTEREILISIKADIEDLKKGMGQSEKAINQNKKAAQGAAKDMSVLTNQLKVLNVNFGGVGVNVGQLAKQMQGGLKGAINTVRSSMNALFKMIMANPIIALITIIASLIASFFSTQAGADKLNKVIKVFNELFQTAVGVVQKLATGLANIAWGLITADAERMKKGFDGVKESVTGLGEAFTDAYNRGLQLAALEKQLSINRIQDTTKLAQLERSRNRLLEEAFELEGSEKIKKLEEARNKNFEISRLKQKQLNIESRILMAKAKANDTSDAEKIIIQEKLAEIIKAQAEESAGNRRITSQIVAQQKALKAKNDEQRETIRLAKIEEGLRKAELDALHNRSLIIKEYIGDLRPIWKITDEILETHQMINLELKDMQSELEQIDTAINDQASAYVEARGGVEAMIERTRELTQAQQVLAGIIVNNLVNGLAMAIEQGENFGDTMKRVLKSMIIQLIAAIVKAKLLFALTGGASAGGGWAAKLIAPKFAKGGAVTGPTLAIVGDNPSGKEFITPSESIGQLAGAITRSMGGGAMGGNMGIFGRFDISGDNLRVILNRNNVKATR